MKILDIDMDYYIHGCLPKLHSDDSSDRLDEDTYGGLVWNEQEIRTFLEHRLGLSKTRKIPGRIVTGHNEALFFWNELISDHKLFVPFEVVHVDSHADLGSGYPSIGHICHKMLSFPVDERPRYACYYDYMSDRSCKEGIGDYLLFAIAYRMISELTYCGNPNMSCADYPYYIIKDFDNSDIPIGGAPERKTIQLLYNPNTFPGDVDQYTQKNYIASSIKEPEVPFNVISRPEDVHFYGDFDYVSLAQSPNYTPKSADYIMDLFREYIVEI